MAIIQTTKPVRKGEELPEEKIKQFLLEQHLLNSINSELNVSQFSNGYSNLTYLLQIEDKELVLRRPPFSAPKRGHDMGREYKVLKHLNPVFNKAPKVHGFCEDTTPHWRAILHYGKGRRYHLNRQKCASKTGNAKGV